MVGDRLEGDRAVPQHDGRVAVERDDRRLDTGIARSAVDDQVDPVAELGGDVIGACGADAAEAVGARRRDRDVGCRDDRRGDGM